MNCLVLCGGLGTRLAELHRGVPKVLAPVCGQPFIEGQLEWLKSLGLERVFLASGYGFDQVAAWARTSTRKALPVEVLREEQLLGTAGAIREHAHRLGEERFLVVNGDTLLPNLNLQFGVRWDDPSTEELVLFAVTEVDSPSRSGAPGQIELDTNDRVVSFGTACRQAKLINGGCYVLAPKISNKFPRVGSLEADVLPQLVAAGQVVARTIQGPILDMGTPAGLLEMENFLKRTR